MRTEPRIVLSGPTGFVGRSVVARLARSGAEMWGLVRPHSPRTAALDSPFRPVEWDLREDTPTTPLPAETDVVVHIAATMDRSQTAEEMDNLNCGGTRRLLQYAIRSGARLFVYISTGGVAGYSRTPIPATPEGAPMDGYTRSKWQGERLVAQHAEELPALVLRLFFPFGPGQEAGIVPRLLGRVRRGEPVTLYNGGQPRINPIYVGDVADIVAQAAFRTAWSGCTIVNAAGPDVTDIRQLADRFCRAEGRSPLYQAVEDPTIGDMVADIRSLRDIYKEALVPLDEGLARVLEHE